jgi:hypothetical protein
MPTGRWAVTGQLIIYERLAQLGEGMNLDLSDTFFGQAHPVADGGESFTTDIGVVEREASPDDG